MIYQAVSDRPGEVARVKEYPKAPGEHTALNFHLDM